MGKKMSEGKLKKHSVSVHDIWRTWGSCLPVKATKKRLIPEELIDEAKKEFPMAKQLILATQNKIDPNLPNYWTHNPTKIAEWFLEYFGDSAVKQY